MAALAGTALTVRPCLIARQAGPASPVGPSCYHRKHIDSESQDQDMAGSLKDQLLKAGIASKKQAKEIELEQRKKRKQGKPALSQEDRERAAAIEAARREKTEKDRRLNEERRQQQTERATRAEIRQLADQHRVIPPPNADVRYNFVWDRKVRSLWIDRDLQGQLASGVLRLIAVEQAFLLVPSPIAERIIQRDPAAVVQDDEERTREIASDEQAYAEFSIPDDLHW
jgi:uncharacterized protein YaiL (DUF2058 family)